MGESLNEPMVTMEDGPTVRMPAYADDPSVLDWQTEQRYVTLWCYLDLRACGSVWKVYDDPVPDPWLATCAGPGDASYTEWAATAEDGRAAIEEHIAAHVRRLLSGADQ